MLGCLHRGVVLAPLPPMFNETQLVGARRSRRGATAIVELRRREGDRQVPQVAGEVALSCSTCCPSDVDAARGQDLPADRDAAPRRRPRRSSCTPPGTTSAPKGIAHSSNTLRYATEGVCRRWGLTGDDIYLDGRASSGSSAAWSSATCRVLLNGATGVLLNRWNAEDALRLIEEHRCTYVLAMPTHAADMIRAAERDRPRPVLDARARRPRPDAASGAWPCARPSARRRSATTGCRRSRATPRTRPTIRRRRSCAPRAGPYDGTEIRIVDEDEQPLPAGKVGAVIVNGPSRFLGFFNNDELTRESLTDWGGYRTGDLGYARRGRPLRLRRAQQGHHPPRRRDDRPGRGGAGDPAPPGGARGRRSCRCRTTGWASARARPSSLEPGPTAPTLAELQQFLEGEGVAKYTWPESVEVFEDFPRTPSLKVVKRDVVNAILGRSRITA